MICTKKFEIARFAATALLAMALRGSVFKPLESTAAEEIAAGMSGVKEVKNDILCCKM